jgi:transposase
MPQVDVITDAPRHRRWSLEEKQSILAAAFAPGAIVAEVARRANVSSGLLYTWRKELMAKKPAGFSQMVTVADLSPPATPGPVLAHELPAIEIETRGGYCASANPKLKYCLKLLIGRTSNRAAGSRIENLLSIDRNIGPRYRRPCCA